MKKLIIIYVLAAALSLQNCQTKIETQLSGYWKGVALNNNQPFTMGMEFFEDSSGISGNLLFPKYGWKIPFKNVQVNDTSIVLGNTQLGYDRKNGTISGVLPPSMVPDISINFELHKTEDKPEFRENTFQASTINPMDTFDLHEPVWAEPVSDGKSIYIGTLDKNFYAINPGNLAINWKYNGNGEIRGKALIQEENLYFYSDDGLLHKLDKAGNKLWTFDAGLTKPERNPNNYDFYSASPVYHNGEIFYGNGEGNLFVVNSTTGEEIRRYKTEGAIRSTPVFSDGNLFYAAFNGNLYKADAGSDEIHWTVHVQNPITSGPVVVNDKVIFGDRSYYLTGVDKESGTIDWKYYYWFSWIESTPAVYENLLYVGSSDSQMLNAINPVNGSLIWEFDTGGCPWSSPLVTEDYVFTATVGTEEYFTKHYAYLICLERETGNEIWRYSLSPQNGGYYGFAGPPVMINDRIWIVSTAGKIYSFPVGS